MAIALVSPAVSGCGGGGGFAEVSGRVTLDGKALETGAVTFHSQNGSVLALGQIGADGQYSVAVDDGGLPPGDYVVTVTAAAVTEEEFGQPEATPESLVPGKYTTTATTDLKFTLEPGSQTIDLELKGGP